MDIKLLEESTKEEVLKGYSEDEGGFKCLLCGEYFTKGEIYEFNDRLYDAHKMVQLHIEHVHESVLSSLLKLTSNDVGISELQLGLLSLFAGGLSDKQISEHLGVASSTIRNHRYKLREKEKQAKIFLAIMELLEEKQAKLGKSMKSKVVKNESKVSNSYIKINDKNSGNTNEADKKTSINNDKENIEEDIQEDIKGISKISDEVINNRKNSEQVLRDKESSSNSNRMENYKVIKSSTNKGIGSNKINTNNKCKSKEANSDIKVIRDRSILGDNGLESEYLYVDNRDSMISEQDRKTILAMHVNEFGRLKTYPTTPEAQKVILEYVIKSFNRGEKYIDSQVNVILMSIYVDYNVLKKELIDQGFLSRSEKGGIYWVKGA